MLSRSEKEKIKSEIVRLAERHSHDVVNLDYKAVMRFYGNVEDFTLFGMESTGRLYDGGSNLEYTSLMLNLVNNRQRFETTEKNKKPES